MPLVLSRKAGESIKVDGPAEIKVLEIRGSKRAVFSVTAAEGTKILRGELDEEKPHNRELGGEGGQ